MVTQSAPGKKSAFLMWVLVVIIPLSGLTWWLSDIFLPTYRWTQVDFVQIAKASGREPAELMRTFKMVIRHAPRFKDDPMAWQVVSTDPIFQDGEEKKLVRATIISDRTGRPVPQVYLGSGSRIDQYWHVTGWRLPPGALGFNSFRPVILYDGGSLEKCSFKESATWDESLGTHGKPVNTEWSDDDDEVEDGTTPKDKDA